MEGNPKDQFSHNEANTIQADKADELVSRKCSATDLCLCFSHMQKTGTCNKQVFLGLSSVCYVEIKFVSFMLLKSII